MLINMTISMLMLSVWTTTFAQDAAPKPTPLTLPEMHSEAADILDAARTKLYDVPSDEKKKRQKLLINTLKADPDLESMIGDKKLSKIATPNGDVGSLTLQQTNKIIGDVQNIQLARDPTLKPTPPEEVAVETLLTAHNHTSPNTTSGQAGELLKMMNSVGRLFWTDNGPGGPGQMWTFEGTVFVSFKGVVATNCHVIENIINIKNGKVSLNPLRTAVIDFSGLPLPADKSLPLPANVHKVLSIAALSASAGCDVAALRVEGADDIPPLNLSSDDSVSLDVAVIGYPMLAGLTPLVCSYAIDLTSQMFCDFQRDHPGYAKVISEGPVYKKTTHEGVGVFSYSASTRGGQSGSPVISLTTLKVIGIHYCCTGSSAVDETLPCTTWHPQDVTWNEAISAPTLLADPDLHGFFTTSNLTSALKVTRSLASLVDAGNYHSP
jgi:S1-C subfamily serine protease